MDYEGAFVGCGVATTLAALVLSFIFPLGVSGVVWCIACTMAIATYFESDPLRRGMFNLLGLISAALGLAAAIIFTTSISQLMWNFSTIWWISAFLTKLNRLEKSEQR